MARTQLVLHRIRVFPEFLTHCMVVPIRQVSQTVGCVLQGVLEQDIRRADTLEAPPVAVCWQGPASSSDELVVFLAVFKWSSSDSVVALHVKWLDSPSFSFSSLVQFQEMVRHLLEEGRPSNDELAQTHCDGLTHGVTQ